MNRIRILSIFPSFALGGQQSRFATLANNLGDPFEFCVVSLDGEDGARKLLTDETNVEFISLSTQKSSLLNFSNLAKFRNLIKEQAPDILCTHNWGSIEAVIANRLGLNVPNIHFEDGFGPDESPDQQSRRRVRARKMALRRSTIVVPSRILENVAAKQWKLPQENIRRISNGVDFARFQQPNANQPAGIHVGSVGALRREKNYERLIRSFLGADLDSKAKLTIVGDGPERDKLKAVISQYGAEDRVFLPGATTTPERAYSQFDVFALSSDTEQAPLSLLEAMATGLPVVATNVGDIAEMVVDENRSFITPVGDDVSYTQAIAMMLQNPTARAQLGSANRKKAAGDYSLEAMVRTYRSLFTGLVDP